MKYIIVSGMPVLFSEGMVHKDVAGNRIVDGAGFVSLYPGTKDDEDYVSAKVYGESFSLHIGNRGEIDNKIIEMAINNR